MLTKAIDSSKQKASDLSLARTSIDWSKEEILGIKV